MISRSSFATWTLGVRLTGDSETIGRVLRWVRAALHAAGRVDIHTGPSAVKRESYAT